MSLSDGAVQGFKNDCYEVVALGAFDLLEGLNILVLGTVHDGENFGGEVGFISGPLTT